LARNQRENESRELGADAFIDPKGQESGVYYVNHAQSSKANAVYKHVEGADSRKVALCALSEILAGEETTAPYSEK
jgi:hypothetical protein